MADIDHEIREVFGIIGRLLNAGQMPGIAHQLKLGAGDQFNGFAHQIRRCRAVFAAGDSQGWQSQSTGWRIEIGAADRS